MIKESLSIYYVIYFKILTNIPRFSTILFLQNLSRLITKVVNLITHRLLLMYLDMSRQF